MEIIMTKFELTTEQIKVIYQAGVEGNFEAVLETIQDSLNEGKSIMSPTYLHLEQIEEMIG